MWKRASDSYFELLLPCFAWRMMLFWFILHKQLILLLVRASPIIIFIDEDQKWPAKLFVAGVAPRLDVLLVSPKLTCALFTTTLNFNWEANANHWCECLLPVFDRLVLKYHSETCILTSWWMYFTSLLKISFVFSKRSRDCLNFAKINSEDFVFFMRVLHQFFASQKKWWHVSRWLTRRCGQKNRLKHLLLLVNIAYCLSLVHDFIFFPMLGRKQAPKQPLLVPRLRLRPYVRNK